MNKDEILNLTRDGLDVFRHYFGGQIRTGRKFRNPFYDDTNASCSLYYDEQAHAYKYKDFGNDTYSGDCFDLVATVNNLNCHDPQHFIEILRIINQDLNLGLSDNYLQPLPERERLPPRRAFTAEPKKRSPPASFAYSTENFTSAQLAYWRQYGICLDTLTRYHVVAVSEFSSWNQDGKPYSIHSTEQQPMFGYQRDNAVKIYRPYSSSRFLRGGASEESYCFGLGQLPKSGDTLFITGGEKDVMSLAAHGYSAICFSSESAHIPQKLIDELEGRFNRIVLLYDSDSEGLKYSLHRQQELQPHQVERLILPLSGSKKEKDISDYFRLGHTAHDFEQLYKKHPERPQLRQYHKLK